MAWYCFDCSRFRVQPQRMFAAFPLQVAAVFTQMPQQRVAFHWTTTVSRIASCGTPRKPSSRLSSRIRAIASDKLARHSSTVRPCPFAPGISGQKPINQSPSSSMTDVNSLRTRCLLGVCQSFTLLACEPTVSFLEKRNEVFHLRLARLDVIDGFLPPVSRHLWSDG